MVFVSDVYQKQTDSSGFRRVGFEFALNIIL